MQLSHLAELLGLAVASIRQTTSIFRAMKRAGVNHGELFAISMVAGRCILSWW